MDFGKDEEERTREQAVARERAKGEAGASLIEHMRLVGKLDGLREQQTLQKQLQLAAQLGDADKVRQLQAKLAPDDPRKGLAQQNYGARRRGASGAPCGPLTALPCSCHRLSSVAVAAAAAWAELAQTCCRMRLRNVEQGCKTEVRWRAARDSFARARRTGSAAFDE